jgi:parallel beta-helix repeat protein
VSATTGLWEISADTTRTEDHCGQIEIIADNVTFDCDGHRVVGSGSGTGFPVHGWPRAGVTVRNSEVNGFGYGISITFAESDTVENNHVHDNRSGTSIANSGGMLIGGNVSANNERSGLSVSVAHSPLHQPTGEDHQPNNNPETANPYPVPPLGVNACRP